MYVYPVDNDSPFFQGDIVDNFPLFLVDISGFNILKQDSKAGSKYVVEKSKQLPLNDTEDSLLAVETRRQKVIILTQTCDIQQRDTIVFAPVYSISEAISEGRMSEKQATGLRHRKVDYWFYLPELEGVIEESYIDFQIMHYIPKDIIMNNLEKRFLSLSHWGRHHLGWALSVFFGRPIKQL